MLKAFLERRRLKKTFARYFSPAIARQLADGRFVAPDPVRADRTIEIAFIAISAPDASNYSERAGIIANIASQHGGIVHSLLPVVVIAFGSIHAAPSGALVSFVASVQSLLPKTTAIVHGSIAASVGAFGGESRCDFGFWWPGSLDALRQLSTLSFGEAYELARRRIA